MMQNNLEEGDGEDKFSILTTGAINTSISEKSSSSLMGAEEHSSLNGQSSSGISSHDNDKSSGLSSNDKYSDESKEIITSNDPIKSIKNLKNHVSQKSLSYQDLHSEYTKKKFKHVKSKVREYIADIREQDRQRQNKKLEKHRSLPETFLSYDSLIKTNCNHLQNNCNGVNNYNSKSCNSDININDILMEKERELAELKTVNSYLQSILQEKRIQLSRLERNSNATRIELMQSKKKEKEMQSQIYSLTWKKYSPRKTFPTSKMHQNKISIGVQVNCIGSESFLESPRKVLENPNLLVIKPIPLDYNNDSSTSNPNDKGRTTIRRRSNSNTINSTNNTKNDMDNNNNCESEIEVFIDDYSEMEMLENTENKSPTSLHFETSLYSNVRENKRFRRKWRWILGAFCNCLDDNKKTTDQGVKYMQIPFYQLPHNLSQ